MSKLKYAVAMLAAGGGSALASQAGAATTVTLNLPAPIDGTSFSYDISLGGSLDPQFKFYGGREQGEIPSIPPIFTGGPYDNVKHHLDGQGTARLNSASSTVFEMPTSEADIVSNGVKTYNQPYDGGVTTFDAGDTYYQLAFDIDATRYLGVATIGDDHSLRSITYDVAPTGGIPEPDTWALMIMGVGAAGAVMRRQRRLQATTAL
jgi:hypothetical protein